MLNHITLYCFFFFPKEERELIMFKYVIVITLCCAVGLFKCVYKMFPNNLKLLKLPSYVGFIFISIKDIFNWLHIHFTNCNAK